MGEAQTPLPLSCRSEAAHISADRLLSTSYRDAKRLQAILTRVNTLAISERNKRCKDVLYGIVTRNTHEHSTSFKQIFSGRISESLEKGKYRRYTMIDGKSIGGLARIYFFKLELI